MAEQAAADLSRPLDHTNGIPSPNSDPHAVQYVRNLFVSLNTIFALKAAIQLGVLDILAREGAAGGAPSLSVTQIAGKLNCEKPNVNALRCLLRLMAAQGFLMESAGFEDPCYSLNSASTCLVGSVGLSNLLLFLTHSASLESYNHLLETVTHCNSYAFEKAHGKQIFEYVKENPAYAKVFNASNAYNTRAVMASILKKYTGGFKDVKTIVDVGGGNGASLSEIVRCYPHISGINFDQPHVVANAPPISGVEHVGGDMFESVPSADVVIMKNTLLDWDDESCLKILRNCHNALPLNGKTIIVEPIIDEKHHTQEALHSDFHILAFMSGGS